MYKFFLLTNKNMLCYYNVSKSGIKKSEVIDLFNNLAFRIIPVLFYNRKTLSVDNKNIHTRLVSAHVKFH